LDLPRLQSIEADLVDILSLNESERRKKVRFTEGPRTVFSYTVSVEVDPSGLKLPPIRSDSLTPRLRPKLQSNSLVERGVDCVATKLLDLSQCEAFEDDEEAVVERRPSLHDTADSIQLRHHKINEKQRRRLPLRSKKSTTRQLLNDIISGLKGTESVPELFTNQVFKRQFIRHYVEKMFTANTMVRFDSISVTTSNGKIVVLDTNGLTKGRHEWTVKILKSDVEAQEIGVVANDDIANIEVDRDGVLQTNAFGARSCFGSELCSDSIYYGSFNKNGQKRCFRDLTEWFSVGWCVGDQITVKIDLKKFRIRYLFNGQPVRYCMSLQPGHSYHPFISFSGNCKYSVH